MKVEVREFRASPFAWQSKKVLRHIRKNTTRRELSTCLCIYLALTEIASDRQTDEPEMYFFDISKYSGLSEKTVSKHLKKLEDLEVVKLSPQVKTSDGRFSPVTVTLKDCHSLTVGTFEESSTSNLPIYKKDRLEIKLESNIGNPILKKEEIELPDHIKNKIGNPSKNITKTYQEQAFRFAKNLKINLEEASKKDKTIKGRWIGAFKRGANVNGAYSKCFDSEEFNRRDDLGKIYYFFKVL